MDTRYERRRGLLAWQWAAYPEGHRDRGNLAVHALTVPVFCAGTVAIALSPFLGALWALVGAAGAVAAIAFQARTHRREAPPAPFRGPADVALRLAAEQWITYGRG
jgi:hypothetical protein